MRSRIKRAKFVARRHDSRLLYWSCISLACAVGFALVWGEQPLDLSPTGVLGDPAEQDDGVRFVPERFWAVLRIGIAIAGILLAFSLAGSRRSLKRQYGKIAREEIEDAGAFAEKIQLASGPFTLIFRPFGYDGMVFFPKGRRHQGLVDGTPGTVPIEAVCASLSRQVVNAECYMIVEPEGKELLRGPRYLSTGASWRSDVTRLLQNTLIVFIVIPPECMIGESLRWEIKECLRWGLQDRMVILFPPKGSTNSDILDANLHLLKEDFPGLGQFLESTAYEVKNLTAIYPGYVPHENSSGIVYFLDDSHPDDVDVVIDQLYGAFSHVESQIRGKSRGELHPYSEFNALARGQDRQRNPEEGKLVTLSEWKN